MKNGNENALKYSTVITARDRGDVLVERVCHGVVVDKYTTRDLKIRRRSAEWSGWITEAANTPLGVTAPPSSEWDTLSDDMMCELEPFTMPQMFSLGVWDRGHHHFSYAVMCNGRVYIECGSDGMKASTLIDALNTYAAMSSFDDSDCSPAGEFQV